MRRVALERVYLERKLSRNTYRSRVSQELQREVTALPEEGAADLQFREEYLAFVAQRRGVIEALLKEGPADSSHRDPVSELRVALGGLIYLASCKSREALMEFAAAYSLLSLPYVALQIIFQARPTPRELVQNSLAECLKDGLPFTYVLSLRPEGQGTGVELALREYEEGLEGENLAKVFTLMAALRQRRTDYLFGPCAAVLALAYYCDKPLFSRLVVDSANPAFIHLVLSEPEYAYDLEALWMIAGHGGLWARVEVFHHLIQLLRECNEATLEPREAKESSTLSRALRRVIAVYLGRVIILLLATKKPGLLGYVVDALSVLYRGGNDSFMLYFLGKCVGRGISLYLSEADLEQQLDSWEPSHSAWGLMYLLYGAQVLLESNHVGLMQVLNRVLLGKWLAQVWKAYRGANDDNGGALPFTSLDLAVWKALAQRWKTRSRTLRFLNGVCRRLQAVEGMWFSDSAAEAKRRNALYAGLRAHARAWSMLPPEEGSQAVPAFDLLRSYIADQRNWEANREAGLKMPSFFTEVLACISS